jgi:hypothetical protein
MKIASQKLQVKNCKSRITITSQELQKKSLRHDLDRLKVFFLAAFLMNERIFSLVGFLKTFCALLLLVCELAKDAKAANNDCHGSISLYCNEGHITAHCSHIFKVSNEPNNRIIIPELLSFFSLNQIRLCFENCLDHFIVFSSWLSLLVLSMDRFIYITMGLRHGTILNASRLA